MADDFLPPALEQYGSPGPSEQASELPESLQPMYDFNQRLRSARERLAAHPQTTGMYVLRRSIPVLSATINATQQVLANRARERMRQGTASPADASIIAAQEELERSDRERTATWSGYLGDVALHIPAVAGEAAIGGAALRGVGIGGSAAAEMPALFSRAGIATRAGQIGRAMVSPSAYARTAAQTATMPSMYLEDWAQRGGRLQDLPPAFAVGMLNTAILGRVGAGEGNLAHRLFRGIPVGIAEQQAVDAIGSAVSEFLPESMRLQTGYGLVGDVVNGHGDEALRHGLGQALTFGVFAGIHGGNPRSVPEAAAEVTQTMRRQGVSQAGAGRALLRAQSPLADALRANPDLGRAEALAIVNRMPPGFSRDFARRIAEALPEHRQPAGPQPGIEPPIPGNENAPGSPTSPDLGQSQPNVPPPAEPPAAAAPERPATPPEQPATSGQPLSSVLPAPAPPPMTFAERLRAQLAHEAALRGQREAAIKEEGARLTPDQREEMAGQLADLQRDIREKSADPHEVEQWQERARHLEAVLSAAPAAAPKPEPPRAAPAPSERAAEPAPEPPKPAGPPPDPTSPREMLDRIDAEEQTGKLAGQQATILRQRMDGLTVEQIGKKIGLSRQRVHQIQKAALDKLGLPADVIETLIEQEKARRAEIMHRGAKRLQGEVHEQRNDLGVQSKGLDALATQILEAHEHGDRARVEELLARANRASPGRPEPAEGGQPNPQPPQEPPAASSPPAQAENPAGVGAPPAAAAGDSQAALPARPPKIEVAPEVKKAAIAANLLPSDLQQAVDHIQEQDRLRTEAHNAVVADARKRNSGLARLLSTGKRLEDPAKQIPGWHRLVNDIAREHAEFFGNPESELMGEHQGIGADPSDRLQEMLIEGRRKPITKEQALEQAVELVRGEQERRRQDQEEGRGQGLEAGGGAYQPEEVAPGVFFRQPPKQPVAGTGGLASRMRLVGQEGMPGEPGAAFLHRPAEPPPEETSALANAETRRRRYDQGLQEIQQTFRPTDQQVFEAAKQRIESDPQRAVNLVDELERSPRPATIGEDAELLAHLINLTNRYQKAREAKSAAWDALDRAQGGDGSNVKTRRAAYDRAAEKAEALRQEFNRVDQVLVQVGRENSDGLRFRQRLATLDYSLLGIVRRAESAANRSLNEKEIAELEGMARQLAGETERRQLAERNFGAALKEMGQLRDAMQMFQSPAYQQHQQAVFAERQTQAIVDRRVNSYRWEAMTPQQRAMSWLRKLYLNFVISGPTAAVKVGKSAIDQLLIRPVHEIIGSGLKMIPGLGEIAAKAPIEGRGFDAATEQRALAAAKGALGEFKQILTTGNSRLDILYGGAAGEPVTWLDFIGNLHAAEKQPAVNAEFERARSNLMEAERQRLGGRLDRLTPADIDAIEHRAYTASLAAKFSQENAVVQGMDRLINGWKASESPAVRAVGHALDFALPVRRIPTNIVFDAFEHVLGAPWAASKLALMGKEGRIKITDAQAETILRQLKRGTLGLPLAVLGVALGASGLAGGFYSGRRTKEEPEAGSLFGLPGWLMAHHPALMAIQVGASAYRESHAETRGEEHGPAVGTLRAFTGLLDEVPFVREQTELGKLFEQGGLARMAGSRVSPQAIQWLARNTDREPGEPLIGGETQQRRPQGFLENAATGVPGLRQMVTEGPPRAVRDYQLELSRLRERRRAVVRRGERFPDERRYATLEAFHSAITQLDHAAQGLAQSPAGLVPMRQPPTPERVRELRQRQAELATRALSMTRTTQ